MPKRSSTYLLLFLLLCLAGLVFWLNHLLNKVEAEAPAQAPEPVSLPPALSDSGKPPATFYGTLPTEKPQIDEANQVLADQLNAPGHSAKDDLEVVSSFIELYRRAFRNGNPVGDNLDITGALTGTLNPDAPGRVFPPRHNAIRSGQLVDRWGTPYWFHPESAFKMEIRSAGPDKSLFTEDDVVLP